MKLNLNSERNLCIAFGIVFLILSMFMAISCSKDSLYEFDPDCGIIASKVQVNNTWITIYKWNDNSRDTIMWHFDPVSNVGDTVCKLHEVNINDYNCKP